MLDLILDALLLLFKRRFFKKRKKEEAKLVSDETNSSMHNHHEEGEMTKKGLPNEKFLSLWRNAEPGIAELEDEKKRMAGLKTQFLREIMAWKIRGQTTYMGSLQTKTLITIGTEIINVFGPSMYPHRACKMRSGLHS